MRRLAVAVGVALAPAALAAQAPAPPIAGVEIVREPIFDARQGMLARLGNAVHVRTREFVVRRELLLRPGDPFDSLRLAETARNLRATGVFRRALVDTVSSPDGPVLRVLTRDGWSLRPTASLTTSSGQSAYTVGLADENFLGLAATLSALYRSTPDRTSLTLGYRQPRAFAGRIGVSAAADLRSDGTSVGASVGQPFFTFASRRAWDLGASDFDGDVLRFRDGNAVPFERLRRRYAIARGNAEVAPLASPRGYLRVGLTGQLRRDDFVPAPAPATGFPRTTTALLGVTASAEAARFLVLRNVRSFLREEDVAIGPSLRVSALASPRAFGYPNDGLGLAAAARLGTRVPGGYAALVASANGRFAGGLDSGRVTLASTLVLQPAPRHALLGGAQAGWQKRPVPGEEFDLGLGAGLRAFPLHAFTGDRFVLAGAEYRWTASDDAFGLLGLGLAAFGTWGGAWYADEARRTGTEVGVGLRWGFTRGTDPTVRRVDLVRRLGRDGAPGAWSVVVGEGFAF